VIAFRSDVCRDWARATSREWLETNGIGGYASGTIAGAHTRRYHGLLIAALRPPTQRTLLLSKLEETLAVEDIEYDLSCNQYRGAIHPEGYQYLAEFRLDPFPTWTYEVGGSRGVCLEKTVAMCRGKNLVVVAYRLISGAETASLVLRPIVNCRDHHHLMRQNVTFDETLKVSHSYDQLIVQPYPSVPPLFIYARKSYFDPWPYWYHNFEYAQESARGLDDHEDQYSPGYFTWSLKEGQTRYLVAGLDSLDGFEPAGALDRERQRRKELLTGWSGAADPIRHLACAADAFLVGEEPESQSDRGIIAGYPWFEEWGRDAMISLPGIALVTGRYEAAKEILTTYLKHRRDGLIPNRIPSVDEEPDYNTVDATLWLFWAMQKYLAYTGDRDFVAQMLPILSEIIDWHVRGTLYGIHMDKDGLIAAGEHGTQLTWMDAKVGDWVVTPRHAKPVEINALWHNALQFVEELGGRHSAAPAGRVAEQFRAGFWNEEKGYLNDVIDGDMPEDASLRPNQVIALALPSLILDPEPARRALAAVERELLTPFGLRTLSPRDSRYRGRYRGDQRSRDSAYHQGTVWPWLMGPFITACIRMAEDRNAARELGRERLSALWDHIGLAGVGSVSEIFDGDAPHRPQGCIAQAWSVAELLRVAVEELEMGPPAT